MVGKTSIRSCSIWRALEILGDAPTLLILESFWLGARRFDDFIARTALPRSVVSARLKKLVEQDCLRKVPYQTRPRRSEYRATPQLADLYPLALSMLYWESRWGAKEGKLGIALTHADCGPIVPPVPVCSHCRRVIDPREVHWQQGPGMGEMPAGYSRRRRMSAAVQNRAGATTLFDDISSIIGDRWSTLIIRAVFTNLNRYDQILEDTGISTNILAERLNQLCEQNVLSRVAYQNSPARYRYHLTEKGRDIYPILLFLMAWGDRWLSSGEGPPVLLTHKPCGQDLQAAMACGSCEQTIKLGELEFELTEADAGALRQVDYS